MRVSDRLTKIGNGSVQALLEGNETAKRFFAKVISGRRCFGSSAGRGEVGNLRFPAHFFENELGQLEHGKLARVSNIYRADRLLLFHQANKSFDEIVHVAKNVCEPSP